MATRSIRRRDKPVYRACATERDDLIKTSFRGTHQGQRARQYVLTTAIIVAGGAKVLHVKLPDVRVAAAQKCATDCPSLVCSRGGRCSAWNCIGMSGWRLSMRA